MSEQDTAEEATTADDGDAGVDGEADIEGAPADVDAEAIDLDDIAGGVDEQLVERVADADPEELARELAALRSRNETLEAEVEELRSEAEELEEKLKRKQAEFQNYKKRMEKRREEEKQRATEDLVTRLLDVRDNLQRALEQDEDADIRGGVESTLRSFDDVLDEENVEVIEPEPGEEVDPHRHEVLVRVESDQPEDSIAELHRPGYDMAGGARRSSPRAGRTRRGRAPRGDGGRPPRRVRVR